MTNSTPLVSVIIPTYNSAEYIGDTIESILNQTHTYTEIIVVDDGSSDNTLEVLERYTDRILILTQENQGASMARNLGLCVAKGEFIAFLDSDDIWHPRKLELQIYYLAKHSDIGAVYSGWYVWQQINNGSFVFPDSFISQRIRAGIDHQNSGWLYNKLLTDCILLTSTVVIRTSIRKQTGLFDESLRKGQDYDYWLRLSRITKIDKLQPMLVLYRQHTRSITNKPLKINYTYHIIKNAVERWGISESNREFTPRSMVNRRLAQISFNFGYDHFYRGNIDIAIEAFNTCLGHRPFWLKAWRFCMLSQLKKLYSFAHQLP